MQKRFLILILFISLTTSNAFSMFNLHGKFVEALKVESSDGLNKTKVLSKIYETSPHVIYQTYCLLEQLFIDPEKNILNESLIKEIEVNLESIISIIPQYECIEYKSLNKCFCIVINRDLVKKLNYILDVVKKLPEHFLKIAFYGVYFILLQPETFEQELAEIFIIGELGETSLLYKLVYERESTLISSLKCYFQRLDNAINKHQELTLLSDKQFINEVDLRLNLLVRICQEGVKEVETIFGSNTYPSIMFSYKEIEARVLSLRERFLTKTNC